jgi:N-acetylmuramoyl-L-alanine amidase
MPIVKLVAALGAAVLLGACASATGAPATPTPSPVAGSSSSPALPPIPLTTGPLAIRVVYPPSEHLIESRDSNFVLGSVGNGKATLTINGTPVPVAPNGAFLAYLPLPPHETSRYDLVATVGSDTASLAYPVKLGPAPVRFQPVGPLTYDSASVTPPPTVHLALRDDDLVRVFVRAPSNASVTWRGDAGASAPLVNGAAPPGPHLFGNGVATPPTWRTGGDAEAFATDLPARLLRARTELVISRGADTLRVPLGSVAPAPSPGTLVILGTDTSSMSDTDRTVIGRPTPGGTYKWFLLPGTVVPVTGWSGDFARVRLDTQLEIWVSASEARLLPTGTPLPHRVAGSTRLVPAAGWVDFIIPLAQRPAFLVEEGAREITLTLYDTQLSTDIVHYGENDSLVRAVQWMPLATDRGMYTVHLASPPFGYLIWWDRALGALVLRVRRPPVVNADAPLKGLTIAVDPGHPPIGATGPTGLYEPVPTLAIGLEVKRRLEAEGATVYMTRTSADPVPLNDRPVMARRVNPHALVSIHLNALPDGTNPFVSNGTGAYYFHPQSIPLARALQRGMVAEMGLRDLGINYDNLALARPTWMPSVLCEGAFLMLPDQENALRTPEFQAAYARGVVDGLMAYFRSLAPAR